MSETTSTSSSSVERKVFRKKAIWAAVFAIIAIISGFLGYKKEVGNWSGVSWARFRQAYCRTG